MDSKGNQKILQNFYVSIQTTTTTVTTTKKYYFRTIINFNTLKFIRTQNTNKRKMENFKSNFNEILRLGI